MAYLITIGIYLGGLAFLGSYLARQAKTQDDFMVAGRRLTAPVLVGTLLATWIGSGDIFSVAVHPTNSDILAIASKAGVYLSKDGGGSFNLITENKQGTSVFFNDDSLWYGSFSDKPYLENYSLESGEIAEISIPNMSNDAVMYFAQNPQNAEEIVFASFNGDVYLSKDQGSTWETLVEEKTIQ